MSHCNFFIVLFYSVLQKDNITEKSWVCFGNMFLKLPTAQTKTLLEKGTCLFELAFFQKLVKCIKQRNTTHYIIILLLYEKYVFFLFDISKVNVLLNLMCTL